MSSWQHWLKAPQTHWLRKILFQVHLWLGLGLGLYVLTISITGSALLLQSPVNQFFSPNKIESTNADELKGQALKDMIAEVYSGYEVYLVVPAYTPDKASYVVLHKDGGVYPRYFNQFTGKDLGASNPWQIKTADWLANVHDDLLMGRTGRKINGVGGGVFLLMTFTGILIWWQGRARWKESLQIKCSSPRGFNWQLHSFIGFWSLFLMFAWGLSGLHLGFPQILNQLFSWLDPEASNFRRPTGWLRFIINIHFARFGDGEWARWAWILVSFLPSIMVVSGFIIWWRRVIMKTRTNL